MPTYARGQIVVEDMVGVYHCIARCVRRAFLCGIDPYTGQDYSHRKEWILDRLRDLAGLFAIEVCGYSVPGRFHSKSAAGLRAHLVARRRADRTGRTVQRLTSSDHAHTMVILKSSVSDRLGAPRAGALAGWSDRRVHGCLNPLF